VEPKSLYC